MSSSISAYPGHFGLGQDRNVRSLMDLRNPFVHHTSKTLIAGLRGLTAERGREPSQGRFSFNNRGMNSHLGQLQSQCDSRNSSTDDEHALFNQFFAPFLNGQKS